MTSDKEFDEGERPVQVDPMSLSLPDPPDLACSEPDQGALPRSEEGPDQASRLPLALVNKSVLTHVNVDR